MRGTRCLAPLLLAVAVACGRDAAAPSSSAPPATFGAPQSVVAWLRANAVPLATVDPGGSDADLRPLSRLVGTAPVVGLGEATHGTSEFSRMKHRILRYLVEHEGFTAFSVEVPFAEAEYVDEYVHTGHGDPVLALKGLYFWTVYTREMLDLIQWMRAYNATVPAARQVHFLGFDMQYAAMPIDSVGAYVRRVDPAAAGTVADAYSCYWRFVSGAGGSYTTASDSTKATCRAGVVAAFDWLDRHRAGYETASSRPAFERALQYARIVVQHEDVKRTGDNWKRDEYMAENAAWQLARLPAGSRIVLWAHNQHVKASSPSMGYFLRQRFAGGYVPIGFLFFAGTFNAVHQFEKLSRQTAPTPPIGTYEAAFQAAGLPVSLLDLHSPTLPSWLIGPRAHRDVGATYMPNYDQNFYYNTSLPTEFDLVIYVERSTAADLMPS